MGRRGWAVLALVAVLAAGAWAYTSAVIMPTVAAAALAAGQTAGPYQSDLYETWLGTHELLWNGRDPYSAGVTADIQRGYFGHALTPADPIKDQQRFVYPLYIVFLLAPATVVPFAWVKAVFPFIALLLLAGMVNAWLAALGWRLPRLQRALITILGVSAPAAIHATLLQQPAVLVVTLMALAAAALSRGRYAWAGGLLALTTIKPQLSLIFVLWLLGWALADWRRRQGVVWSFGGTLAVLLAGAFALLPGWVGEWLTAVRAYPEYAANQSILFWLPAPLLPLVLGAIGLGLAAFAWQTRRSTPGSLPFGLMLALPGVYSILLFPSWATHSQLVLFPAALLAVQQAATLRGLGAAGRVIATLTLDFLLWPWLIATPLLLLWGGAGLLGGPAAAASAARLWPLFWAVNLLVPVVLLLPLGALVWTAVRRPRPVPVVPVEGRG
jgi:hypothetical protein